MVIGSCMRRMPGATSVISSVAGSCSWRAGLTTQLGYLLVSTFGQLRDIAARPIRSALRPPAAPAPRTGTNTRSR